MELKTKYITEDDFKAYFGIDLASRIKSDDNPSNTAKAFLFRIEVRMATYLDSKFARKIDREYPEFTDYQKENYKYALLEQAMYVLKEGDISLDSGYDQDEGIKAEKSKLNNLIICENAKEHLGNCGLWCRKLKNRGRGGYGWWMY